VQPPSQDERKKRTGQGPTEILDKGWLRQTEHGDPASKQHEKPARQSLSRERLVHERESLVPTGLGLFVLEEELPGSTHFAEGIRKHNIPETKEKHSDQIPGDDRHFFPDRQNKGQACQQGHNQDESNQTHTFLLFNTQCRRPILAGTISPLITCLGMKIQKPFPQGISGLLPPPLHDRLHGIEKFVDPVLGPGRSTTPDKTVDFPFDEGTVKPEVGSDTEHGTGIQEQPDSQFAEVSNHDTEFDLACPEFASLHPDSDFPVIIPQVGIGCHGSDIDP